MILYRRPVIEPTGPCPYLPDRECHTQIFLAGELSATELTELLESGWRKFGHTFFRPRCPGCNQCIPLRVPVHDFKPSKSQRRVLKKNGATRVTFGPPRYEHRIYDIYKAHCTRFGDQDTDFDRFISNFFSPSCPGLQSEYYVEDILVGVGFLDRGTNCLSSVYFIFDPDYSRLGLGTFSVLREIEETRNLGLAYYYLGYWVPGCSRMEYKAGFRPHETYVGATPSWRVANKNHL